MTAENKSGDSVIDTDRQYLGGVYAHALFAIAEKSGQVGPVIQELGAFVNALSGLPKLQKVLASPRIGFPEKSQLIDKAIQGKASHVFVNFVKVVTSRGRADCFPAIYRAALGLANEREGRVQATVITAQPVSESMRLKVADRLQQVLGKTVVVAAAVDPDLLGGLVVRVGDTVYDGSLKNQLSQVRAAAIGRANQEIRKSMDRFASET